jgi:hypothetical protein
MPSPHEPKSVAVGLVLAAVLLAILFVAVAFRTDPFVSRYLVGPHGIFTFLWCNAVLAIAGILYMVSRRR